MLREREGERLKEGEEGDMTYTSACPPGFSVFLHFTHFKQGRCQSLPKLLTRSAIYIYIHKEECEQLVDGGD